MERLMQPLLRTDASALSANEGIRSNNFDLLRLLFAVLVILSHSFVLIDGKDDRDPLFYLFHGFTLGEFSVDGFFLLSGYLIVQSWKANPSPFKFMRKRILRIYPGFLAAALFSALIVGPMGSHPEQYFSDLNVWQLVKSLVVLKVPAVPPVFHGLPYPTVNGSMWTIFFEFVCYSAVLVLGMMGVIRDRAAWLAITLLIFGIGIMQKAFHVFPEENFYFPVLRFFIYFFAGGCFRLYRERIVFKPWLALACGLFLLVGIGHKGVPDFVAATAGGYLLFYLAFWQSPMLQRFRNYPDVSYGVYLYGWPVQKMLLWYVPLLSPWTLFPLACTLSLILGWMSWYAIEKPFIEMKKPGRAWRKVVPG
jgi:peptidoglycan/LPS O-acetylase OafA/YrhL